MRKFSFFSPLVALLLLIVVHSATAQERRKIVINKSDKSYQTFLLSNKSEAVAVKFQLNEINLVKVNTEGPDLFVVEVPKAANVLAAGEPDLFYLTQSVIVPDLGSSDIEIIPGNYQEISNIDIAPSKGNLLRTVNPSDVAYIRGAVYERDAFYPQKLASLREPYILRDVRAMSIDVNPVQYNPVTKTLRIYSDITVVVTHNNKQGVNEFRGTRRHENMEREFANIYDNLFINYDKARYTPLEEDGELLIICHTAFVEAMQPFVNWKRSIGRKTTIVPTATTGTTVQDIKTYISNYYNNPDNNLSYVLLVGDGAQIPSQPSGNGNSDNFYGYLAGNDSYNEVFIGRFSAENVTHVQTQVNKIIHYERDINTEDTWLNVGVGIARNEGAGGGHYGEADYVHMNFIRDTLLNYTYVTVYQEYDHNVPNIPNTNAARISQRINEGLSIINYCNHGSVTGWSVAGYESSHVNALTNMGKLPFIWSVACVNGNFVNNTCFAEAWLRANFNGVPTGAIGTMMSTINQAWQPPMTGQDEMVTILSESYLNNIKRTFGGLSINGSMKMLDLHAGSGIETHDTWTLFGDPTLLVRTDVPQEMTIFHNPTLFLGASSFTLSCDIDGALVTLSSESDGEVIIHGSGVVVDGSVVVNFKSPISVPTDIKIVVTAYNKVTYISTISAVPPNEPYVVLNSFATSTEPNNGASVGINLALQNISQAPYTADNVIVTLTTDNQYVTITDNNFNAGTIMPTQVVEFSEVFSFNIADNIPDQTAIRFTINIWGTYNGTTYNWQQHFVIKANAPSIQFGAITIDGGNIGLADVLDPGETANVKISLSNTGHIAAQTVSATLTSLSEFLTINDGAFTVGNIAVGESKEATFSVTALSNTPLETGAEVKIIATFGQYVVEQNDSIVIGLIPTYNMSSTTETTCVGRFYDTGGASQPYSNQENITKTFLPATPNAKLNFTFKSFDLEANYDKLYIYDGSSTSAQQFAGSPFSGVSPGNIRATNEAGAITFRFTSDNYINKSGWEADLYCVDMTVAPESATNPNPTNNGIVNASPLTLSWSYVPNAEFYDVYFGENTLPSTPVATVTTNEWSATVRSNKNYVWKVVPKNSVGEASNCPVWRFRTHSVSTTVVMHSGSITTCNSRFYDSGGNSGQYQANENYTLTVYPASEGAKIQVTFSGFETEANKDILKIYDGISTTAPQLANLSGSVASETITATNTTGALTFNFISDLSVNKQGWEAKISCVGGTGSLASVESFNFTTDVIKTVDISEVVDNKATIDVVVNVGTDITNLTPTITISAGATMNPYPGVPTDFTTPVKYNVTSGQGTTTNEYTVNVLHEIVNYMVTFVVKNQETTVEGVKINVNNTEVETNQNGEATMELSNGHYTFVAHKDGYQIFSGTFVVNGADTTVNINMLGINNNLALHNIKLYPNPVKEQINITNTSLVKYIKITNSIGVDVMFVENRDGDCMTISLNNLAPGLYLIALHTTDGNIIIGRIVKQ